MSTNCSNASSPFVAPSHFGDVQIILLECLNSAKGKTNLMCYLVTNMVVLIPLYAYIQYLGLRRWCRQQSALPISHSDAFTYHMIIMEQLSLFGAMLTMCGLYSFDPYLLNAGHHLSLFNSSGENAFHLLTCLERYVAVTYPIAYLNLLNDKWIRLRNATIGLTWLFSVASVGILYTANVAATVIYSSITGIILGIAFYCCFNVLCILIRPRPIDGGGPRQRVDQSKLRAFYTITLILVVLVFRSMTFSVTPVLVMFHQTSSCSLITLSFWLSLPSNLVLPLLYLRRAGKLPGFKHRAGSG